MTEQPAPSAAEIVPPVAATGEDRVLPGLVYVLYLCGLPSLGITTVLGVILAYFVRATAGPIAQSHYTFLINSFWMFFGWCVIAALLFLFGLPLSVVLVGIPAVMLSVFIFSVVGIWFAARCIVGLVYLAKGEAYPRPRTWLV